MLDNLLRLTEEFIKLATEEYHLLNTRQLTAAQNLHQRKNEINADYQLAVLQMRSDPAILGSAPKHVIHHLYERTQIMRDQLKENERLLSLFASANDKIIKALVHKMNPNAAEIESYTPFGKYIKNKKTKAEALAISASM